ncbi:MAG TPA: diguanylate cyclase [Gallionella sp.]|nr:diguanylate cyclase [Gallionella sp.]
MHLEDIEASEKFLFTLKWMLAVTERYPEHFQFGLAHIDFQDPKILGETYGAQKASQKLDEVLYSLRKVFRKTDLVVRDGVDFWILLPYVPTEEKLVDKIKYIIETASQGGLHIVERDISIFSLSPDMIKPGEDYSASRFLAYLKENHATLAWREISLPESN